MSNNDFHKISIDFDTIFPDLLSLQRLLCNSFRTVWNPLSENVNQI